MSKKTTSIVCDDKMNVTNFFGFRVADNAIQQKNCIDFTEDGSFNLFIDGEIVANITWFDHFFAQSRKVTENEIWNFLRQECRKYTKAPFIYIDKFYVEEAYSPLADCVQPTTTEEIQKELEDAKEEAFWDSVGESL